jgi:NAD(P)-dependent dehydrogenase (short-subunit alcohol dehydrogenase family)
LTARRFEERVAVVTGGGSGIGLATGQRFSEEGAKVALLDRDVDAGQSASDQIRKSGGICEFIPTDVASESEVIRALEQVVQNFGGIDHLVNNAGIVIVKGIEDCSAAEWDRVIDVNLKSVFLTVKYALPWLRRSPQPSVVNIGSVSSFIGQQRTPAYVASKGGVLLLSKALALDLAPDGIRVNCVCPGIIDTPMFRFHINTTADPERTLAERLNRVPLRRALAPREIADSILYLSGPESSGVTGTSLVVDAGYTAAAEWSQD